VVGHRVTEEDLAPLPGNIEVHRWIPQLAVLGQADAFVSHAGMGSVTEALYTTTPVVLLPQLTEQDLVAEQVTRLGLGRVIPRETLSAAAVREAVADVLGDADIGDRLAAMARAMRDAGGAVRAADEIEHCAAS